MSQPMKVVPTSQEVKQEKLWVKVAILDEEGNETKYTKVIRDFQWKQFLDFKFKQFKYICHCTTEEGL
jgi:hypothetical protein